MVFVFFGFKWKEIQNQKFSLYYILFEKLQNHRSCQDYTFLVAVIAQVVFGCLKNHWQTVGAQPRTAYFTIGPFVRVPRILVGSLAFRTLCVIMLLTQNVLATTRLTYVSSWVNKKGQDRLNWMEIQMKTQNSLLLLVRLFGPWTISSSE